MTSEAKRVVDAIKEARKAWLAELEAFGAHIDRRMWGDECPRPCQWCERDRQEKADDAT